MTARNWRAPLWLTLIMVALLSFNRPVSAQGGTSGNLSGTITDETGAIIPNALVTLTDRSTGVSRVRTARASGTFLFSQLAPGEYDVLVENLGFVSMRVTAVPVRPGRTIHVQVALRATTAAVAEPDVVPFDGGAALGTQPQFSQWMARTQMAGLPLHRRSLDEVLRLSSQFSRFGGVEGLPHRMLGVAVDGLPYRTATGVVRLSRAAFPLSSFEGVQLAINVAEVERSGFAGPILNAYSRRGGSRWQPSVLAQYTVSATGEDIDDADKPVNGQGAFLLGGPLRRDTAQLLIGAEFGRYDLPFAAPWLNAGAAAEEVIAAGADQDLALEAFAAPGLARTDLLSAFAGTTWQVSGANRLEARVAYGSSPRSEALPAADLMLGNELSTTSLSINAALLSEFRSSSNELRVAFTNDEADSDWAGPFMIASSIPFTTIGAAGVSFGGSAERTAEYRRRTMQVSDAFTAIASDHLFKLGAIAEFGAIEQTRFYAARPEAWFGTAADLSGAQGLLVQPIGAPSTADFSVSQFGAFLQDTWRPAPGIEILMGVRYEQERLPASDIAANAEWERLTGMNTSVLPESYNKVSPRFALRWDAGGRHEWIFGAGAGLYHDQADANLLAAAIANTGSTRVRRQLGAIPSWTDAISSDTAGSLRALTILPDAYRPPVSVRASAGLTRILSGGLAAHISGTYRQTRNLPRAADLNLWVDPLFEDQHGRPVFGVLQQVGGLIAAEPGSNRRFGGFDHVIGINTDAESKYTALTFTLERMTAEGVNFVAAYTYSQTKDDWYGAAQSTRTPQVAPQMGETLASWHDGTSDFDVPHRAAIGIDVPIYAGARFGAVYRYESGAPFTPIMAHGVDVNGDGFANDPAFVDDQIDGVSALTSQWDCLRTANGQFAERNACRSDAFSSLDLRLTASVLRGDGRSLQLFVEGLNVLQSEIGVPDAAVYRIDPEGAITENGSGQLILPLQANPEFGQIRYRAALPRLLRIGARLNW